MDQTPMPADQFDELTAALDTPDPAPVLTVAALRRSADEAVFWASIKDTVAVLADLARYRSVAQMGQAGSVKQQVDDADGEELGTVSIAARRWAAVVTDPAAFFAWVKENRPNELVSVIRDSYIAAMQAQAEGNARDTNGLHPYPVVRSTGERIPGIEAQLMPGRATIRKTRHARDRAREALARMLGEFLPHADPELIGQIQAAVDRAQGDS